MEIWNAVLLNSQNWESVKVFIFTQASGILLTKQQHYGMLFLKNIFIYDF